jgi:hypothetical protein
MTKQLLSEEQVEWAALLQADDACELRGAARAEYEYWQDQLKQVESEKFIEAPVSGADAKKAWAKTQDEYKEALQKKREAAKLWFVQQEAGNAAQRILDVWRTLKADARRSNFQ